MKTSNLLHNKKLLIGLAVALLAVAGIAWWILSSRSSAASEYQMAAVTRGPLTQAVSANGTLNPVVLVTVGSQVSGIVRSLHADFNDHVKKGQILLELSPTLYRAQLQQSEANLLSANASLKLAEANEKRTRGLYAKQYVTKQDLDTAEQALQAAQAQRDLARAQVVHDRTNLGYTIIRSPVSGVVVSRMVDVGQTVAASFQAPTLFTIAKDLSKMQIDSSYAEADVGQIQVGQQAYFNVDAFPNRKFRGVVKQVRLNPTTVQNVVTYDVVVAVDNPDKLLMPGMTAYVNIVVAQRKEALRLPNAALRYRPADVKPGWMRGNAPGAASGPSAEGGAKGAQGKGEPGQAATVYVLGNEGNPRAVHIRIGISDNNYSEVVGGGLSEGDKVIVGDRAPSASSGGRRGPHFF